MYARTKGVYAGYGRRTILRNFFRTMDDEKYIITGPNGGGKSTLFRVLTGLRKTRGMNVSGEAMLFEEDPIRDIVRSAGMIFQEHFRYYLGSTPRGEISLHLRRARKYSEEKIKEISRERLLEDLLDRPMHRLSDGEKLRVLLAAVLSTEPKGLILDEPLSSLDPIRARKTAKTIKSLEIPALIFEHRREFFMKAHVSIERGTLTKAKPRKSITIHSRREGKNEEIEFFGKRFEIPIASRGIIPIRGPNGSGKTTLLKILYRKLRNRAAYMPSDPSLSLHAARAEEEADRIYRGSIRRLSFGQRKELAVISTLQRKAEIYLLDEPFKGLDDEARERVLRYIEKKSREKAIYLATNERESIHVSGPAIWLREREIYEESYASSSSSSVSFRSRGRGRGDSYAYRPLSKS